MRLKLWSQLVTTITICGVYPELVEGLFTASFRTLLGAMQVSLEMKESFIRREVISRRGAENTEGSISSLLVCLYPLYGS
jgi:hypothetical protein